MSLDKRQSKESRGLSSHAGQTAVLLSPQFDLKLQAISLNTV